MRNIVFVFICLYLSFSLDGQSSLSLDQAIKIGIENNYGLKTSFKEKTKVIKRTLANGTVVACAVVIVEVEEVETTYSSTKKTVYLDDLF